MDDELMHELVAAYALDALDPEDERIFDEHLAHCARCQQELAALSETVGALAYAVPATEPPPGLRRGILDAARAERSNVVPLRPRWAYPALALAAVASCAAVGLGVWAGMLHSGAGSSPQALQALPLSGAAAGSLVVGTDGSAALVLSGLPATPAGKTYEAWVIRANVALPAGLFRTQDGTATVRLSRRVSPGAVVGVTLEKAGGAAKPTGRPLVSSAPA